MFRVLKVHETMTFNFWWLTTVNPTYTTVQVSYLSRVEVVTQSLLPPSPRRVRGVRVGTDCVGEKVEIIFLYLVQDGWW